MCDTQRTAHDGVVLQPVTSPLLQATGSTWLHDFSHVGGELADTGSDLSSADPNNHALGVASGGMAGGIDLGVVGPDVGSLLCAFASHYRLIDGV